MKFNEKNVCAFSKVPPFDLEGYLQKRGDVNKSWQKRYFVLKGNLLFYFDRKQDKEPIGLIILEGCRIELSEDQDLSYCFEIIFGGNRIYTLSANDQKSMEIWMKTLACSSYEYKKALVEELQTQLEGIELAQKNKETHNKIEQKIENITPTATPKAPPRRQNPFNRPAPPPPVAVVVSEAVTSVGSIIDNQSAAPAGNLSGNIHIGDSSNNSRSAEMWSAKQSSNTNKNISNSISNIRLNDEGLLTATTSNNINNSNNALKYNWETFGEEPDNSFAAQHGRGPVSINNSNAQAQTTIKTINPNEEFSFRTVHETFKKIILDDINEYRKRKENAVKPLIEL